ncbi:hypothetical protein IWW48_000953 [Coemansia sp. RSA 1200]|nr:hypothetical protein IWW48_000953 [Coemansia sp. RSA 1200]
MMMLGFHQKCYGIVDIPPGDEPWYCDWCTGGSRTTYNKGLYCCHYKNDKSARRLINEAKPNEQQFVHVQCAAWIPDVDTSQIPFITTNPKLRAAFTMCEFCGARFGYQVRCSYVEKGVMCESAFHPMCAIRYRFLAPPPTYNTKFNEVLCPKHISMAKLPVASIVVPRKRRRRESTVSKIVPPVEKEDRRQSLPIHMLIHPTVPDGQEGQAAADKNAVEQNLSPPSYRNIAPAQSDKHRKEMLLKGKAVDVPKRHRSKKFRAGRLPKALTDDASEVSSSDEYLASLMIPTYTRRGRPRVHPIVAGGRFMKARARAEAKASAAAEAEAKARDTNNIVDASDIEEDIIVNEGDLDTNEATLPSKSANKELETPHKDKQNALDELAIMADLADKIAQVDSDKSNSDTESERMIGKSNGQTDTPHPATRSKTAKSKQPVPTESPVMQVDSRLISSPSANNLHPPMPHQPEQISTRRPTIRVKPFAGSYPSVISNVRGSTYYPLSAGSRMSGGINGYAGMSTTTAEPPSTASNTARLSEEQETWIKESHSMLRKQNSILSEIQKALKDMNSQPTREARKAMSTISSLSALVNSTSAQQAPSTFAVSNGTGNNFAASRPPSPDIAKAAGNGFSTSAIPQLDSSPQLPRPALSVNQLYKKGTSVSAEGNSGSSETSGSLGSASPENPQLPKHAAGSLASLPNNIGAAETGVGLGLSTDSHTKTPLSTQTEKENGKKLAETQEELDELKNNMMYVIKRVNMAQTLLDMLTKPQKDSQAVTASAGSASTGSASAGSASDASASAADDNVNSPAFKMLVGDLKQLGALSKDNIREYMKVFVRSLEANEN